MRTQRDHGDVGRSWIPAGLLTLMATLVIAIALSEPDADAIASIGFATLFAIPLGVAWILTSVVERCSSQTGERQEKRGG